MPGEGGVMCDCQNCVAPMINGQRIDRKTAQEADGVGLREVVGPEEMGAAQFDGVAEHLVKTEENGKLQQRGQATAQRADLVLLEEFGRLLVAF